MSGGPAPVTPGYDARIVFPDNGVYGFNREWRRRQHLSALEFGVSGMSADNHPADRGGRRRPHEWLRDIVATVRRRERGA